MQKVTAPGAGARTFLIHMFRRGLDDNRYVVERYKSTFDGEIVPWPCKGKSKTGKQPRQVMSLGAVQRMRPERDEIIVCTGVKIASSGIQYWGARRQRAYSRSAGARAAERAVPSEMSRRPHVPQVVPDVLRPDHNRGRKEYAIQRSRG